MYCFVKSLLLRSAAATTRWGCTCVCARACDAVCRNYGLQRRIATIYMFLCCSCPQVLEGIYFVYLIYLLYLYCELLLISSVMAFLRTICTTLYSYMNDDLCTSLSSS